MMVVSVLWKRKCYILSFLILVSCCNLGQTAVNDSVEATGEDWLCFNNKLVDKQIYIGCDEAFRLNQSGTINVPLDETDTFCNGPCLLQTKALLACVEKIDSSYVFNNEATTENIEKALDAGCSNSSDRGNFNVGDYVQGGLNNLGSGIPNMGLLARSWIFCMFIIFITNH